MFKLQMKVTSSDKDVECFLATNQRLSLKIWHERLSHQNIGYVKRFLRKMNISYEDVNNFFCEACVMGKQHRLPFPKSDRQAGKVGELVHTDVCGKMHEASSKRLLRTKWLRRTRNANSCRGCQNVDAIEESASQLLGRSCKHGGVRVKSNWSQSDKEQNFL